MSTDQTTRSRGRPKTLDRGRILDLAIESYWVEGVDSVSLNEICRRAKVSKPGLYREFGNEDGLRKAALIQYYEQELVPMHQMLAAEVSFRETLGALITIAAGADRADQGRPTGCLYINMIENRTRLGLVTRQQLNQYKKQMLNAYEGWVQRAKTRGEFPARIATPLAAIYIDAQISNALSQQAQGEDPKTIRDVLEMAFSVFGESGA